MNDIAFQSPLDNFYTAGNYALKSDVAPAYTIRIIKDLSISKIMPFNGCDEPFKHFMKSTLGLVAPQPNSAYIAGTRTILSPEDNQYFVTTEGEARGILAGRLQYALSEYAGIFEKSAAYSVMRIDGYHFYNILQTMICEPEKLKQENHYVTFLKIDTDQIILHQKSEDVTYLFLPRKIAPECYRRIARSCLEFGVKLI